MNFPATPGASEAPSVLLNPFVKDCVTDVMLRMWKSPFSGRGWRIYGTVEFANGDTKGEQRFEAETLDELITKVQAFLKTLQ